MGRTACTEPQCLYKGTLLLIVSDCVLCCNPSILKLQGQEYYGIMNIAQCYWPSKDALNLNRCIHLVLTHEYKVQTPPAICLVRLQLAMWNCGVLRLYQIWLLNTKFYRITRVWYVCISRAGHSGRSWIESSTACFSVLGDINMTHLVLQRYSECEHQWWRVQDCLMGGSYIFKNA